MKDASEEGAWLIFRWVRIEARVDDKEDGDGGHHQESGGEVMAAERGDDPKHFGEGSGDGGERDEETPILAACDGEQSAVQNEDVAEEGEWVFARHADEERSEKSTEHAEDGDDAGIHSNGESECTDGDACHEDEQGRSVDQVIERT